MDGSHPKVYSGRWRMRREGGDQCVGAAVDGGVLVRAVRTRRLSSMSDDARNH